jgi:hypothetical protein
MVMRTHPNVTLVCTLPACIHSVVCLTTGPKPALHTVRSRASSFRWEYPLLCLRSPSSFLRLLPRLPVTSTHSFTFPSITCRRRQFLRKMWPIQLAFRLLISRRISSAPWLLVLLLHFSYDRSKWSSVSFSSTTFKNFPGCFWSTARSVYLSAPCKATHQM